MIKVIPFAAVISLIGNYSIEAPRGQTLCSEVKDEISRATAVNRPFLKNDNVAARLATRQFPSIFQAWNGIVINGQQDDSPKSLAKHDLVIDTPEFFGARWTSAPYFLSTELLPLSYDEVTRRLNGLRALNPSILILASLQYWDAKTDDFPLDSKLWLRDAAGRRMPGWAAGGYFRLDLRNRELRTNVIKRAQVITSQGLFDGIFLDWWDEHDQPEIRRQFLAELRQALGPKPLIFANVNYSTYEYSARYLNGAYLESLVPCAPGCGVKNEADEWRRLANAILFYGGHLQPPKLVATEVLRCHAHQKEMAACNADAAAHPHRVASATALALTLSDGYVLVSEPNELPTPDHRHFWYLEWSQKIGRPHSPAVCKSNGVIRRDFDAATVYFNASDSAQSLVPEIQMTLQPWRGFIVYKKVKQ